MIAYDPFAAALARWLDARLRVPRSSLDDDVAEPDPADPDPAHTDSGATADPHAARLFGLVVMDREGTMSGDDGSVRFVAVAEGEAYELVRTIAPLAIHHHEALALVTEGWAAPLPPASDEDADPPPLVRPSRHPARRRVRVTTVALETGAIGTALRWLGGDEGAVDPGPVAGPLAEALGQACGVTETSHRDERTGEHDRSSAA